jgi:hypothetical protein
MAKSIDASDITSDGYEVLAAPGGEETQKTEWVSPGKGTIVEGVIEKAFVVSGDRGDYRVAYTILDKKGDLWNLGEKQAMRPLRDLKLGSAVFLQWHDKEDIGSNREQWRMTVKARNDGKGKRIKDLLKAQYEALKDDLPF